MKPGNILSSVFLMLVMSGGSGLLRADENLREIHPTFSRDIAPIFYKHCVQCHRPGQVAPMSLISYEDTRAWVKSIRKNVTDRSMPPWYANPEIGHFHETNILSSEEVKQIITWCDAGAPQGTVNETPAPPSFSEGWQLGDPDEIIALQSVPIAADAKTDNMYEVPALSTISEERHVTAVEIRCEPMNIVHHVILYVVDDRKRPKSVLNWLAAWGPGMPPMVFEQGTGRILKKDAKIIANIHLTPRETGGQSQIKVGLHYAPKGTKLKELENHWVMNARFVIPPGEPNMEVTANWILPFDADLYRILPHMHYRGKDMNMTVHFPDGRSQRLIEVKWNNDWQYTYTLAEPMRLPKGTKFEVRGHYDNSAQNPVNPDPTHTVRWAIDTREEMFVGMIDFVRVGEDAAMADGSENSNDRSILPRSQ
ncbi:cytochrome c [Candidatus Sumerlaeota bacterium]|nr:cytochrome c [Candidatus Sumerlaeota bacterium]